MQSVLIHLLVVEEVLAQEVLTLEDQETVMIQEAVVEWVLVCQQHLDQMDNLLVVINGFQVVVVVELMQLLIQMLLVD